MNMNRIKYHTSGIFLGIKFFFIHMSFSLCKLWPFNLNTGLNHARIKGFLILLTEKHIDSFRHSYQDICDTRYFLAWVLHLKPYSSQNMYWILQNLSKGEQNVFWIISLLSICKITGSGTQTHISPAVNFTKCRKCNFCRKSYNKFSFEVSTLTINLILTNFCENHCWFLTYLRLTFTSQSMKHRNTYEI